MFPQELRELELGPRERKKVLEQPTAAAVAGGSGSKDKESEEDVSFPVFPCFSSYVGLCFADDRASRRNYDV